MQVSKDVNLSLIVYTCGYMCTFCDIYWTGPTTDSAMCTSLVQTGTHAPNQDSTAMRSDARMPTADIRYTCMVRSRTCFFTACS